MALASRAAQRNSGERLYNARLIAAAPDLLAACKLSVKPASLQDSIAAFDAMALAIAKAEGR